MTPDRNDSRLAEDGDGGELPGAGHRAFWVGLIVVVLSIVSGLATYLILTGLTPIAPRNEVVLGVLTINVLLILAMFAVIGWQAFGLWRAWRQRSAGARIHTRIVGLFTIIAALPALLLALAATTTFSRSLDSWFSSRTRMIVANSLDVANAYVSEHGQVIRTDIVNMGKDLDDAAAQLPGASAESFQVRNALMAQAGLRDLSLVALIDAKGNALFTWGGDTRVRYEPPTETVIGQAEAGHIPLILPSERYRVAAVTRLSHLPGVYLYAARSVNPKVVGHLRRTEAGVAEYERLREARGGLKLVHGVMYFMISLTGVLAAIWVGLRFASQLVAPIRRLIGAAQQVARGDLAVQLPLNRGEGDLRRLSKNFNHMTRELDRQRSALMSANTQLTERRRFMEAVLSNISAGVIGLDAVARIRLANSSAERLLGLEASDLVGRLLADVVPEFAELAAADAEAGPRPKGQVQVTLAIAGEDRIFAVRVTREHDAGLEHPGSVVTFDDVTDLVSAQRTSAWGDVARRIAHEIKNPLTPIQLSAERIRRKYGSVIKDDRETFDKLTDTIVRQVGDIKSMVDEFASFARVPKPQMERHDLREVVQEPMIQYRETHPAIGYTMRLPDTALLALCDRRLLTQALTNLVKNATEAVEAAAEAADREPGWRGSVETVLRGAADTIAIEVIDNGQGLPRHNRARLLEPYVSTKGRKGTGLGLAIVQKIVEQHGGTLALEDAPLTEGRTRGALIRITLPVRERPVIEREGGEVAYAMSGPV
jgi:two-component system, NtrC family, nitrogen regulation sensor histidine kinase NtrY